MRLSRRTFLRGLLASPAFLSACRRGDGTDNQPKDPGQDGEPSLVESTDEGIQHSFFCFDTTCVIGGMMPEEVLHDAVLRCTELEMLFSRTFDGSDISAINTAGGAPVEVAPETAELISKALDYCEASGGLFDITIGIVTSLWDFHEGIVPDKVLVDDALPHVDYHQVHVDGQTVTLDDPYGMLDLGGIAKGYVADILIDLLAEQGVESAYVNLGGNVKVLGAKPDGSPWQIGVRDPTLDAEDAKSVARIALKGGSVVTSGLYERQFELDGKRYWHILDPRTGYPVESDLVSVTIVSAESIDGDGYTKPPFMWGSDEALAFLEDRGLECLLVDSKGGIQQTTGSSFELL